jgi:hypothetical protein
LQPPSEGEESNNIIQEANISKENIIQEASKALQTLAGSAGEKFFEIVRQKRQRT